ncbi:MAG: ExbD/TolR family protein [Planctomycetota bacterium]
MAIRPREEQGFSLELTPMIDVVFLLIIFFLVATTFHQLEREMAVKVPESDTGRSGQGEAEPIVINILKDGRLVVAGETMTLERLQALLVRRAAEVTEPRALIRADGELPFQRIVDVASACQRAAVLFSFTVRQQESEG